MRTIIIHFDNGDSIRTRINGTVQDIVDYYIDKPFTLENDRMEEVQATCRAIEFLDPVKVPWTENAYRILKRIHSLSDRYMQRNWILYKIRADYEIHYENTGAIISASCAYTTGMFDS